MNSLLKTRKVISFILTLAIIVSLVPAFTVSVFASAPGPANPNDCLTFSSTNGGFSLKTSNGIGNTSWNGHLYYSTDKAIWTTWSGIEIFAEQTGGSGSYNLYLYGDTLNTYISKAAKTGAHWILTPVGDNKISCTGNIETLRGATGNNPSPTLMDEGCYKEMFSGCTSLISTPDLTATTLSSMCYCDMFSGCSSLKEAPELPALTLAVSCYREMFQGCTSLQTAPAIKAETLAQDCCAYMFNGCSSLKTAPVLPVIFLEDYCYYGMFEKCSSLKTAPELHATTLATGCYGSMFYGCTSLENAPALPAEVMMEDCYKYMFASCSEIKNAPALPATTLADNCYNYMFYQCTALENAPALPATIMAIGCYNAMFAVCTALETAPELPATSLAKECYEYMFYRCISLKTAPALPAETLEEACYNFMFSGCTALETAPALPATNLSERCYSSMFMMCTSLIDAPALPATTLEAACYSSMFMGCTALETAPALRATVLTSSCYNAMFGMCTSLKKAPELPAQTLAYSCYSSMFAGCSSLETAPELPVTELSEWCYMAMFAGCTSLDSMPELPATILPDACYYYMFSDCTNLVNVPVISISAIGESSCEEMFSGCTKLSVASATDIAYANIVIATDTNLATDSDLGMFDGFENFFNGITSTPGMGYYYIAQRGGTRGKTNSLGIEAIGIDLVASGKAAADPDAIVEVEFDAATTTSPIADISQNVSGKTMTYLDFDINHYRNGAPQEQISNTAVVLDIIVPFDTAKKNYVVYRNHDGVTQAFTESSIALASPTDGYFYVDKTNNKVHIYSDKFSVYGLGYDTPAAPSEPVYEESSYLIDCKKTIGGSVSADKKYATYSETVTISVDSDFGYTFDSIKAKRSNGTEISLSVVKAGEKYTFKMPSSKVEINAEFTENAPCPKDESCILSQFTDVVVDGWYHDGLHFCVENSIMGGYGENKFAPLDALTRGMLVQILYNIEGRPEVAEKSSYTDVETDGWYADAIAWAEDNSIVGGYGEGLFGPVDNITREQLAKVLFNFAAYRKYDVTQRADISVFTDADLTSDWAVDALKWAKAVSIMNGNPEGTINPTGNATRAEAATMIRNFFRNVVK